MGRRPGPGIKRRQNPGPNWLQHSPSDRILVLEKLIRKGKNWILRKENRYWRLRERTKSRIPSTRKKGRSLHLS
jgi:hypothetical protein